MTDQVHIDYEDADAIANSIEQNLEYEKDIDKKFWQAILTRLNDAIHHATPD